MIRRRFSFSLFFISLVYLSLPLILAFNPNTNSPDTQILQDVLKEIAARQNWEDLEGISITKLEVRKLRFGSAQTFGFWIRLGKNYLVFKFRDEVDTWNKFTKGSDGFGDLVKELESMSVLHTVKLEGPFDLRVKGNDELTLTLPLNTSRRGLKRVLVGEGITLELTGAQQLSYTIDISLRLSRRIINRWETGFHPYWHSLCTPLPPIQIVGSASLVAYRTRNPDANIETTHLSKDTVELLPEKCYSSYIQNIQARPIYFLNSTIARVDDLLRGVLGDGIRQNQSSGFVRANVKASAIVRFQLELERRRGHNETLEGVLAEWRTRPTVEKLWFEVMARVEYEKLKPLTVKKVRPFIAVDSASWSNLMSNISFTKFPSVLVPPEALTLDVKW